MKTVTVVGPGRLGGALAIALARAGYTIETLVYRSASPDDGLLALLPATTTVPIGSIETLDSDVVLICTQDTEIGSATAELVGKLNAQVVLHTSGSLASSELEDLRVGTVSIGSMHPLVSISDAIGGAEKFAGAYFCVEGEARAVEAATELAASIGGKTFSIRTEAKPLYHAAAVMSSGHLVALLETSASVLERCGVPAAEARAILAPLVASTVSNLKETTAARSMTGTYARLDIPAFRRHLSSLERLADDLTIAIYLDLALRSLEIVESVSKDPSAAAAFREEVSIAKRKRRVIK